MTRDGSPEYTPDLEAALISGKAAVCHYEVAPEHLKRSTAFDALLCITPGDEPTIQDLKSRLLPGELERISFAASRAARQQDNFFRVDFRFRRYDGLVRWFMLRAEASLDQTGDLARVSGLLVDLTGRKLEEQRNAYLAAVVASTPFAVISVDLDRKIGSWNNGAAQMFGHSPNEAIGKPIDLIIDPSRRSNSLAHLRSVFAGQAMAFETERLRKDGSIVPVRVTAAPVYSPDGLIVGGSAVLEDRTEQKRSEETQRLLVRELHHRVRNTLATVQGIASVTARVSESIDEFRDAFTSRVAALAQTHYRLTEGGSQTKELPDLVREELEPFVAMDRVRLDGPVVELSSSVAPKVAMALHELATNATKHGSLRSDGGTIEVTWSVDDERVQFLWAEHGEPEDWTPTRRGFGSTLLDTVLPAQFGGEVKREFAKDGIRVSLSFPMKDEA